MDWLKIKVLIKKDLLELLKSKQSLWAMIIVPIIFVVIIPSIFLSIPLISGAAEDLNTDKDTQELIKVIPDSIVPRDFTLVQKFSYVFIMYFFAPFFLIIPVMASSVVAANSFVGEKERRTLEGLLYTPLKDHEILLGKTAVAWLLAMAVSLLSFVGYALIVNGLGWPTFGRIVFPNLTWILMMLWIVPLISYFSVAILVIISQRSTTSYEAQQTSAFMVIPVVLLMISQMAGVLYLSPTVIIGAGLFVLMIDFALFLWMRDNFNRERLVTKLT